MEYSVVAVLVYEALKERKSNGGNVPRPALLAMLIQRWGWAGSMKASRHFCPTASTKSPRCGLQHPRRRDGHQCQCAAGLGAEYAWVFRKSDA